MAAHLSGLLTAYFALGFLGPLAVLVTVGPWCLIGTITGTVAASRAPPSRRPGGTR